MTFLNRIEQKQIYSYSNRWISMQTVYNQWISVTGNSINVRSSSMFIYVYVCTQIQKKCHISVSVLIISVKKTFEIIFVALFSYFTSYFSIYVVGLQHKSSVTMSSGLLGRKTTMILFNFSFLIWNQCIFHRFTMFSYWECCNVNNYS